MKIALHVHTSLYSICSKTTPEEMIREHITCGFEAMFITEHDAIWSKSELKKARKAFPEIKIFPGVEITLFHPESLSHLLILGAPDDDYLYMASPDQVIDAAQADGYLTVLAHPYRYEDSNEMLQRGIYPDALELRTNTHNKEQGEKSEGFATEHSLKLVNSDDSHCLNDIGNYWIETDDPVEHPRELTEAILAGKYGCEMLA